MSFDVNNILSCPQRNFGWHSNIAPSVRLSVTNRVSAITKKNDKGNSIKLHRKIKQNEKVCRTQNLVSHDQVQVHNQRSKVCHLQIVCQP